MVGNLHNLLKFQELMQVVDAEPGMDSAQPEKLLVFVRGYFQR
jgi:hypothetical protein